MSAARSTLIRRVVGLAALASGVAACAMSHPSAREVAHYTAVNLAAPLPYDLIGIYVVNATGETSLLQFRDAIESRLALCLGARGIRVLPARSVTDEDGIRWRPRREPDIVAGVSIARAHFVRGVLLVSMLEMRPLTYDGGEMAIDAQLVDRDAGAVVWARKDGAISTPSVSRYGPRGTPLGPPLVQPADQTFATSVCQLVHTLAVKAG